MTPSIYIHIYFFFFLNSIRLIHGSSIFQHSNPHTHTLSHIQQSIPSSSQLQPRYLTERAQSSSQTSKHYTSKAKMSTDKRKAPNDDANFLSGANQLIKRQKSIPRDDGNALTVTNNSTDGGALIKAVCVLISTLFPKALYQLRTEQPKGTY